MHLGLGTAQFGSAYGITNKHGQVSGTGVREILLAAEKAGMRVIDTAASYGDAEQVLGRILWQGHPFRVITKTLPVESAVISKKDVTAVRDAFMRSLERIGLQRAAGLLLHHANELLRPGGELLAEMLIQLKHAGLVERIGVSCYRPDELRNAARVLPPDLVQVPVNVLDRRFLADGVLAELKRTGTEIHARSAFLQGLLLLPAENHPPALATHRQAFEKLESYASAHGLTRLELALGFLAACPEVDVAVVGVTGVPELENIVEARIGTGTTPLSFQDLGYDDESLLNPSNWRKTGVSHGMGI